MNDDHSLSLEQEFNQQLFANQVQNLSREQAQEILVQLHEQMMIRENLYQKILKDAWGIGQDDWLSDTLFSAS